MSLSFPLAGFDVESTGPDPETDHMVQTCFGLAAGPGDWRAATNMVKPGRPISADATAVHHITEDMVADAQPEGKAARALSFQLHDHWAQGGILVGTNICFDLTMEDRALRRAGYPGLRIEGPVIDTYVLDKAVDRYRKGSRKLVDTCAHYGVPIKDAHDAGNDCFAAVRLAWRIVESSPALRGMTMQDLHAFQVRAYREQMLSLYAYFRRTGQDVTDENTEWPMRLWKERVHV